MKSVKLKYSLEHSWIELKRKVVTIGITDYLLSELGDLIDLSLPKVGEEMLTGISYGEIESISVLHDLIAPIDGEIVKVNSDLVNSLGILQKDPFGNGWFMKVRIAQPEQLDNLMDEEEYDEYKRSIKREEKEDGKRKIKVGRKRIIKSKSRSKTKSKGRSKKKRK
ncbi:MAG: glycine cleavage complex protein H [Candidatus Scalindua rubra]|uniref:Glycine cleavage complex protein H n=1 Tax=Candidatus Scalindua rubra TaxID=1872076 RepID=A0A1E3XBZ8_9BACT|nr:MAG: glycine cleavage complex protein H [Candidatus Scalindua rubra]